MSMWKTLILIVASTISPAQPLFAQIDPTVFSSHQPLRQSPPLPKRAMGKGPAYFVDAENGRDSNSGSQDQPWKTVNHSLRQLSPGDTLYLRAGTYFENVYCAVAGTSERPITIRAFPEERVVVDGGIPEFQTDPAKVWQPSDDKAEGEFVSARSYKNIRDVVGLFGDSNVGLQTYWHVDDLRATNEFWDRDPETKVIKPVYCGPGLWYDKQSGRIHLRLAHTHIDNPQVANYRGETDPRRLPLVIAPFGSVPLFVDQAMHVRFQDLTIRGGGFNSVVMQFGVDIELDNVTVFCGTYGLRARSTGPLRMVNSALYGMIPPWAFRSENGLYTYTPRYYDPFVKEPGTTTRNVARLPTHAVLVTEGSYEFEVFYYPHNHDWEIANCEFTDGHDGVYLSGHNIRFHHNWVDNFQDDAIYLSSPVPQFNDEIHIYQNLITRSLMAFGTHSRGGPDGNIYICRNIADLRRGVNAGRPTAENPQGKIDSYHIFLMHGRERMGVESLYFYQNTFISPAYAGGFAMRTLTSTSQRTKRRSLNNVFVYLDRYGGLPPYNQTPVPDIKCDGNLHWCADPDVKLPERYLEKARECLASQENKSGDQTGWAANSIVGDPKFLKYVRDPKIENDYRLQQTSPAIRRGIMLPGELNDPLRPDGESRPDVGALPVGSKPFAVGRYGRVGQ